ncbi:hypothetical protein BH11BAC3_BH11BAC3_19630 [soil metagenome]
MGINFGNTPLVTIGIPVYNAEKYITATLNSVEQQVYPAIELIVLNDGSTDNSFELIKYWAKSSKWPVTILHHEKNKGLTASCNALLNKANGKYFQKLDADDLLKPDKILNQVNVLEKSSSEVALVYGNVQLINEDGLKLEEEYYERIGSTPLEGKGLYNALLESNFVPNPAVLTRTGVLKEMGGYDTTLLYEDWDMWLKISRKYSFIYTHEKDSCYRISSNSMMMGPQNKAALNDTVFAMLKNQLNTGAPDENIIWNRLKMQAIYSFYSNSPAALSKLKWYYSRKKDLKIAFYYILALLRIRHPSAYLKRITTK